MSAPAVEAFPAVPASSPNVAPPAPAAPAQPWATADAYQMPSAMPPVAPAGAPGIPGLPGAVLGHDANGAPVTYDPYHYMMMSGVVDDNAPPPPPPPPDAAGVHHMGPPGAPGMGTPGSGNSGIHTCERCSREFTSKRGLTLHMRTHSDVKPLQCQSVSPCEHCCRVFTTKRGLSLHLRQHFMVDEKPQVQPLSSCFHCDRVFKTKRGLSLHLRMHSNDKLNSKPKPPPDPCPHCGRVFQTARGASLHLRTHQDKARECQTCHQRFATSKALLDHRRLHEAEQPFRCSLCPKSFGTRKGLDIHLAVHEGNLSYKCNRCLKQFSNSSSLAAHISRCNSVEKTSFLCKICGVPVGKRGRKAHMSIHAQCASCKQWFAKDSDLKLHIATHPVCFPCTVCDAVFEDKDKLEGHMQCHRPTGASPTFDCDVCGQSYANKFGLKSHQISSGHELQTASDPNIPPPPQPGAIGPGGLHMAAAAAAAVAAGWPGAAGAGIPGAPPPPYGGVIMPGSVGVIGEVSMSSSSATAEISSSARRRSSRSPSSSPPPPPPPGSTGALAAVDGDISPESPSLKLQQPSKKRPRGESHVGEASDSGDSSAISADSMSQYPPVADQSMSENTQHVANGTVVASASSMHDGGGAVEGDAQPIIKRQRLSDAGHEQLHEQPVQS